MAIISSLTTDSMPPITIYLAQIRDLINPAFTEQDLPDELIEQDVFLRKAELDTYDRFAIITGKREIPDDIKILHNIFPAGVMVFDDTTYDQVVPTGQFSVDQFGTKIAAVMPTVPQQIISDKARICVMYRTAANIIPALPQILDEWVLRNKYEYAEIDWDQRKMEYEGEADKSIGIDPPDPDKYPNATVIANIINKFTFF